MRTATKSLVSRTKFGTCGRVLLTTFTFNRANMPRSSARVDSKGRLPRHSAGKPGNNDRKGGAGKGNWCGGSLPSPQTDLGVQGFRDGLRRRRLAHRPKRSTLRGVNNQLNNGIGPPLSLHPWMTLPYVDDCYSTISSTAAQ